MSNPNQTENHEPTSPAPTDLTETQLKQLRPAAVGVNRDQLMFAAGHAAALAEVAARRRFSATLWPLATAALLVLNVSLAGLWWQGRTADTASIVRITPEPKPVKQTPTQANERLPLPEIESAPGAATYLALRNQAVAGNWDAFDLAGAPTTTAAPVDPLRARLQWLRSPENALP